MENIYEPTPVEVARVERQSGDVRLLRLKRADGRPFPVNSDGLVFVPGQFVLAGLWGYGEAPFGPASDPGDASRMDILVRRTGQVTAALHTLGRGSGMTLRGPFGNGFPLGFFSAMADVLLVTGGCGIPPIAALVRHIIRNREGFGRVHLVYGARTADDILLKKELKKWEKSMEVIVTVESPDSAWQGRTGLVSKWLPSVKIDASNTVVAMCGPGPMVGAIERLLNPMGISDRRIFVSVERRMQCGVGRCQHCVTGDRYVCVDGPVFNLDQYEKGWD